MKTPLSVSNLSRVPEGQRQLRSCGRTTHLTCLTCLALWFRRGRFVVPCAFRYFLVAVSGLLLAWAGAAAETAPAEKSAGEADVIARIREEGLEHSQVMETLGYLCDVIGPRLGGSPNLKRANEWTRERLACWGLTNAHLEAWGPFGRGWSLKRFSAQVVEPQTIPLIGCPNAWSPGFDQPLVAEVVYLDTQTNTDLTNYAGKLKGAIVLAGQPREVRPRFEPLAVRISETNLLQLANAGVGNAMRYSFAMGNRGGPPRGAPPARFRSPLRSLSFLAKEGAALVVNPSMMGDGGTFVVAGASAPVGDSARTNFRASFPRVWATNAPAIPPQITLAAEDYNRLVHMIQKGEKLKMAVDLQVQFHDDDLMAYNTLAEIPGGDLKDEVVMLGGHLDSWHAGTGATDNGAGVAAAMEAARILAALKLHPRRTIRVALWSGEEQGLLGSRAYVAKHFGYYTNLPAVQPRTNYHFASWHYATNLTAETTLRSPKDSDSARPSPRPSATNSPTVRTLVRLKEYEKLSAYFNLDNGAGKIRGVYMQSNEAVRPLFRAWLEPFRDLGAETLTVSNTGGTDHLSFDDVGLPAFQFIQDPLDYGTRTHHTNEDVLDRIQPEDLKQASVILAAFAYDAAMAREKLPRKPSAGQRP